MRPLNRRQLSLQLTGLAGAAALATLGLPSGALAQGGPLVEGKDYVKLRQPAPPEVPGKIDVIEFFWYGCPHCFALEPTLEPWVAKLPSDVHFRRIPVAFDALKQIHAQIFYTWEALGLVGQMHKKTFDRFHVARKPINREQDMLDFAKESGLDVARVKSAWESFGVLTKVRQAQQAEQDFGIDHMPQFVVGGRYVTGDAMGGENLLPGVDKLIALARKGG
ncbi:MAG TPA: thiol:disulfide interchange protein DsbA/DsbL [Burkholderiaceae bacterium]